MELRWRYVHLQSLIASPQGPADILNTSLWMKKQQQLVVLDSKSSYFLFKGLMVFFKLDLLMKLRAIKSE